MRELIFSFPKSNGTQLERGIIISPRYITTPITWIQNIYFFSILGRNKDWEQFEVRCEVKGDTEIEQPDTLKLSSKDSLTSNFISILFSSEWMVSISRVPEKTFLTAKEISNYKKKTFCNSKGVAGFHFRQGKCNLYKVQVTIGEFEDEV